MRKQFFPSRTGWLYSSFFHGALLVALSYVSVTKIPREPVENPVRIRLIKKKTPIKKEEETQKKVVGEIAFNPNSKLGKNDVSITPKASLEIVSPLAKPIVPTLDEKITISVPVKKHSSLEERVDPAPIIPEKERIEEKEYVPVDPAIPSIEPNNKLEDTLEKYTESTSELNKKLDEMIKDTQRLSNIFDIINNPPNLAGNDPIPLESYNNSYPAGERNEVSYSEFWRSYAGVYVTFKCITIPIYQILKENKEREHVLSLEVSFDEEGTFQFHKITLDPEFKDDNGKVYALYKKFFSRMPKEFIPLSAAGLSAPFVTQYVLINNAWSRENASDNSE